MISEEEISRIQPREILMSPRLSVAPAISLSDVWERLTSFLQVRRLLNFIWYYFLLVTDFFYIGFSHPQARHVRLTEMTVHHDTATILSLVRSL